MKLQAIQRNENNQFEFVFTDGNKKTFSALDLRDLCPCANCVDEWTRERKVKRSDIKPDLKPMEVELVGRYAVQIRWSDGHKTGIYPFDFLYELAKHIAKERTLEETSKMPQSGGHK